MVWLIVITAIFTIAPFDSKESVIFLLPLMGLLVSISDTVGTIRVLFGVVMPIFPILTSTFNDVINKTNG